ncbi:MAG TPA: J domain-containing protein [Polyangia bacterium]
MGIGKRIVDLAKANLNALLDKASGETGIDELTDDELEAELRRRRERRQREEEERKAAARAAENARQKTASKGATPPRSTTTTTTQPPPRSTQPPPRSTPPPPRRDERRKAPPPMAPSIGDKRLRELYSQLEVPYGAPFEEVKKSFRRLMRKYHPDLHAGNPQKHQTATQLTMSLTQAYNELEQHLTGGRRS